MISRSLCVLACIASNVDNFVYMRQRKKKAPQDWEAVTHARQRYHAVRVCATLRISTRWPPIRPRASTATDVGMVPTNSMSPSLRMIPHVPMVRA
jgi:hypothetical protein